MGGMRRVPDNIHREVLRRDEKLFSDNAPSWYAIWLGHPHAEGSELIGRAERTTRARWWRFYPVTGEYPQTKRGWTNGTVWLLEVREGHEKTRDSVTGTEGESVTVG